MEEVRDWLRKIKLAEYAAAFERAGYDDMETIKNLEPDDLKEIGMQKAGHRKKILAMAKKLNEAPKKATPVAAAPLTKNKVSFTCHLEAKKPALPKGMSTKEVTNQADMAYNKKNWKEAFKLYLIASNYTSHSHVLNQLAFMWFRGLGTAQNFGIAMKYYKRSANQGNARAQYQIGLMYYHGYGVDKDFTIAHRYFNKASKQNHPSAILHLGVMYYNGIGLETPDFLEALKKFREAAELGNVSAQCNLAMMYKNGVGTNRDMKMALKYYQAAANQGDAGAQYQLGMFYKNGYPDVDMDLKLSVKYFQLAAAQGLPEAQYYLGIMYHMGHGVKKDYKLAAKFYQLASMHGISEAQSNLGFLFASGRGCSKNLNSALQHYQIAALKKNPIAHYNIGIMYRKGLGVVPNNAIAYKHFEISSRIGNDSDAHFQVGIMLEAGQGADKNIGAAVPLFRMAASRGHPYAWIKFHAHKKSYEEMLVRGNYVRSRVSSKFLEGSGPSETDRTPESLSSSLSEIFPSSASAVPSSQQVGGELAAAITAAPSSEDKNKDRKNGLISTEISKEQLPKKEKELSSDSVFVK